MDLDEELTIVNDGSEWLTFMFDRPFNPDKPFEGFLRGYLILKVNNAQPVQTFQLLMTCYRYGLRFL